MATLIEKQWGVSRQRSWQSSGVSVECDSMAETFRRLCKYTTKFEKTICSPLTDLNISTLESWPWSTEEIPEATQIKPTNFKETRVILIATLKSQLDNNLILVSAVGFVIC